MPAQRTGTLNHGLKSGPATPIRMGATGMGLAGCWARMGCLAVEMSFCERFAARGSRNWPHSAGVLGPVVFSRSDACDGNVHGTP
jgi:hypothetical protein